MKKISVLPRTKANYKDLGLYLKNRELLGESGIWFAGYDDGQRSSRNAVMANLFYGKKRLQIVTIKDNIIYLLKNTKKGFILYEFGKVTDSYNVRTWHNFIWPSIKIEANNDQIQIKATKNKKNVSQLKKIIK